MKSIAFILLGILAACYIAALVYGLIAAFPAGVLGLIGLIALALLLVQVLKDRLENDEDDYYSNNVDK